MNSSPLSYKTLKPTRAQQLHVIQTHDSVLGNNPSNKMVSSYMTMKDLPEQMLISHHVKVHHLFSRNIGSTIYNSGF